MEWSEETFQTKFAKTETDKSLRQPRFQDIFAFWHKK